MIAYLTGITYLWIMRKILITLLAISVAVPAWAQSNDARYQECSKKASTDPHAALKEAEQWMIEANVASAQHCKAIALFGLKRYRESAAELQRLAIRLEKSDRILWANVLHQAARSWELSGNRQRALASLDYAISGLDDIAHDKSSAARMLGEILLKRSEVHVKGGDPLKAVQDLDHAVSLQPKNDDFLLARAEVLKQLGENALAKQDVEAILKRNPRHAQAKALLSKL